MKCALRKSNGRTGEERQKMKSCMYSQKMNGQLSERIAKEI